MSVESED